LLSAASLNIALHQLHTAAKKKNMSRPDQPSRNADDCELSSDDQRDL